MTPTNAYTRAALGLAGRTLRTTFRNPALLMPPLIAPLIFFTIFGGGLGALGGAPAIQVPVLMAMFFAPAFAPLVLLTGWIHGAATWNPISYLLSSGRGFLAGDPTDVLRAGLVLGVLIPLLVVWAGTGLRRAERTV